MSGPIDNADFLEIDPYKLDREWLKQARLYFQYGQLLADARQRLDEAKSALELVDAELDADIRLKPEDFGLSVPRLTESIVRGAIVADPEHRKAERAVILAKRDVGYFDAATTALDHKKRALEGLVQLHLSGYYAEPRARGDSREMIEEAEKTNARRKGRRV